MQTPSLYFHIPFCPTKCNYCSFYSELPKNNEIITSLLSSELTELKIAIPTIPTGSVPSIYIGGGSPSSIPRYLPGFIENILQILHSANLSTDDTEFTVELNPGDADKDFITQLYSLGVNRLSIGCQSFDDIELKLLGRRHTRRDIEKTVDLCRIAGFDNISLDLIFALPGQTLSKWQANLRHTLTLTPQHISAYSLTWEPQTLFAAELEHGTLKPADDQLDRDMYYCTIDLLANAGINQYEISNFARTGFQSRHNLRYWQDQNYLGFGPAAGSHINETRQDNIPDTSRYIKLINENSGDYKTITSSTLTEQISHAAILALRTTDGIKISQFLDRFKIDPIETFADAITLHSASNLLTITTTHIKLTPQGLSLSNTISADFIL